MKFELQLYKMTAMKNLFVIFSVISSLFLLSSCSTSKDLVSGREEVRGLSEDEVRNAIESRQFIIKLDRLYTYGVIDLRPRSNYIIVDGRKAIINAAYLGRQYDFRPIAGINMKGTTSKYEVTNKVSKGKYDVKMKVENGATAFDVYLTIDKNGDADASVNGIKIGNARYRGYVVPLTRKVPVPLQDNEVI
jgi:hypothetical protein